MYKSLYKINPILMIINNSLIKLPSPKNISIWWNFGSLLGMMLMIQVMTGFILSMHYCPNMKFAFISIIHINQDMNFGWLMRLTHLNGASMMFMFMYLHIGRGMYYSSFFLNKTWLMGIMIYLLTMMTAFMGYVLPWGQMSFWGATVITNLISTIPYIGLTLVEWIWGGFSINNPTLNRFFSFHFILPMIIIILMMIHLLLLHENGSNNPLGMNSNLNKIPFHIYFTYKDMYMFILMLWILLMLIMLNPYIFSDPENFTSANPMITPIHIQPEWYFLFAYSILRSIPNKLGGVIALLMSIMILIIMPFLNKYKFQSCKIYPFNQLLFWLFTNNFMMLTWLGSQPIEEPFINISQINTLFYFLFYLINPIFKNYWDQSL